MSTFGLGAEGFRWFIGKVEDRDSDPSMLGRVKVRMYNIHPESRALIATEELPWATILGSPNSAGHIKIGRSPTGIMNDSIVIGFYIDGNDGNQPVIMGTIASIQQGENDIPPEAREINEVVEKKEFDPINLPFRGEPYSAYATKYPMNKVLRTENGHVIEVDDTPGKERIHVFHTTGTYWEIDEVGRLVHKCVDNSYEVVLQNKDVHVIGDVNIKVDGNVNIKVDGNWDQHVLGNYTLQVDGNYDYTVGGNVTRKVGGVHDLNVGGKMDTKTGGNYAVDAPRLDLNSGVAAPADAIESQGQ